MEINRSLCCAAWGGVLWSSCAIAAIDVTGFPTELKVDYRLPFKSISRANLGLREKEVFSFVWHPNADRSHCLFAEKWVMYAIQGMVNRAGPMIWLDHSEFGYLSDVHWRKWYQEQHGFVFLDQGSGLGDLLKSSAGCFNGVVVYDDCDSDNHFLAANIASLNLCIPVSVSVYEKHRSAFDGLPVVLYLSAERLSRQTAYNWIATNCIPLMDRTCSYCPDARFADNLMGPLEWYEYALGADIGFYFKCPIYNVSSLPAPSAHVAGGPNPQGIGMEGSPEDHAAFATIMQQLLPPARCYGWGTAEADQSRWGHVMVHTPGSCNLSFHAAVKPLTKLPFVQNTTPRIAKPEPKVYIAFTANEGDTMGVKCNLHWGGWENARQGKVPVTWYVNPFLIKRFPAVFDYYFMTSTPNDYFACAPSGAGYCHLDFAQPKDAERFIKFSAEVIRETINVREVSLWASDRNYEHELMARYYSDLRGILPKPMGAHQYGWLSFTETKHLPVLRAGDAYYWFLRWGELVRKNGADGWSLDYDKIIRFIEEARASRAEPCFIEFYGLQNDLPDCIAELREKLDPRLCEIVDLGTLMHLAAQVQPSTLDLAEPGDPTVGEGVQPAVGGTIPWTDKTWREAGNWIGLNGASVSQTPNGIKISLAKDQLWGLAQINSVRLPLNCTSLRMTIKSLTGGSWVLKITDTFDPTGALRDYVPLGEFPHLGTYTQSIDPALVEIVRSGRPLKSISIGCAGAAGAEVVFEDLSFFSE